MFHLHSCHIFFDMWSIFEWRRLGLDMNISTKYLYVTKHTHTARMKKPRKSCFCECNEN